MIARDRQQAVFADVERDGRDMGGGIGLPLPLERRHGVELFGVEQIVERHDAVGERFAEAADIADRKHLGGCAQRQLSVIEGAGLAARHLTAGDQRLGADARQRGDHVGAAPQQRQRRDDHARPQHAEHGQHVLDDVGQLHADDGIGRKPHAAQPSGDRRHHAVGFGIGEPPRRAVGERPAVWRVDQRQRVGPPLRGAADELIERHAALPLQRGGGSGLAQDHCSVRCG